MFFCAISGAPPTAPVVSKTSGTVYEKALIERYIEENGTDPISGEPLTKEDLVDVKAKPSTLPPRPSTQTSIPALLTSLQSEYDAIMLESLEIKKAFQSSRQELANALYREDAATRVIARIMKERDEARDALASIQQTVGFQPAAAEPAAEDVEMDAQRALPKEVEDKIMETNQALSSVRKKRKPAPGYVNAETLKTYTQVSHVPSLHATSAPGIASLDLSASGEQVLTGGMDKVVQVFDLPSSKVVATLKGHKQAVKHVAFNGAGVAVSGSADKTVKTWSANEDGKWALSHTFSGHKGEITGLAVHPSGAYFSAASADSTWSMYDFETNKAVHTYTALPELEGSFAYSSFAVHPDGVLHGGGAKGGAVRVWDARNSSALAATLNLAAPHDVTTLSFSENGYYLAAASSAAPTVTVFDLRKLSIFGTWDLPADNAIHEVRFDPSAQVLSVAGTDLRMYANKTWDEVKVFDDNAGVLTGARFGPLGKQVVVGGMDRTIRVLGQAE